jgi:hypothetical protein
VPSIVVEEVTPYLTEIPASGSDSAGPKASGLTRVWRHEYVALGMTSRVSGCFRSWRVSVACLSMKLFPAGTSGQEADIPRRLTRRQKRIPIRTSAPLLKRSVVSGRRISAS